MTCYRGSTLTTEKATDGSLTSENWEYILDVCDKVNEDPEDGARNAMAAVMKRLNQNSANVQIYTLIVCLLVILCLSIRH